MQRPSVGLGFWGLGKNYQGSQTRIQCGFTLYPGLGSLVLFRSGVTGFLASLQNALLDIPGVEDMRQRERERDRERDSQSEIERERESEAPKQIRARKKVAHFGVVERRSLGSGKGCMTS